MDTRYKPGMVLLAGNSHPGLAEEIARHLGTGVGSCLVYHNTNRNRIAHEFSRDFLSVFGEQKTLKYTLSRIYLNTLCPPPHESRMLVAGQGPYPNIVNIFAKFR